MDIGVLGAIISGFVALMGLFFGAQFWAMQKRLIEGQQKHIVQKNEKIDELQDETRALRDRIDVLERNYYKLLNDLNNSRNMADNYIALVDSLKIENFKVLAENDKLKARLDEINPLP